MNALLEHLKELVAVPSVNGDPKENMPFGEAVDQSLDVMLDICKQLGLTTFKDPDGYYGYAQVGDGEDFFGVLCHLDVVPVGTLNEWHHPPFEMHVDDEFVYGRGVMDDKGPTMIALYALVDLLKAGKGLKLPVRFIFGLDEESHWRCIDKYKADGQALPIMGFVPDSDFPLTYAEKGVWQVNLLGREKDALTLEGGVAFNVVPGEAFYDDSDALRAALDEIGFAYDEKDGQLRVIGKNAHAAAAPEGKNALTGLMSALHGTGLDSKACQFAVEKLLHGVHGDILFTENQDEQSGLMTVNLGMVRLNDQEQRLSLDIRHPVTLDINKLRAELKAQADAYEFDTEDGSYLAPIYLDRESELIQKLMKAYRDVSGDTASEPQISGGATFARSMDNCVAFGASLPGAEDSAHQPNEKMSKHNIQLAYEIYQKAFEMLVMKE